MLTPSEPNLYIDLYTPQPLKYCGAKYNCLKWTSSPSISGFPGQVVPGIWGSLTPRRSYIEFSFPQLPDVKMLDSYHS